MPVLNRCKRRNRRKRWGITKSPPFKHLDRTGRPRKDCQSFVTRAAPALVQLPDEGSNIEHKVETDWGKETLAMISEAGSKRNWLNPAVAWTAARKAGLAAAQATVAPARELRVYPGIGILRASRSPRRVAIRARKRARSRTLCPCAGQGVRRGD
jgi:hypothetical protein